MAARPREESLAHTSLISLDVADTLSDTLVRGHTQCQADGIAVPMPCLKSTRPSTDTLELTADELTNRETTLASRRVVVDTVPEPQEDQAQ